MKPLIYLSMLSIIAYLVVGCASAPASEGGTEIIQSAPAPMFIHPATGGLGPRPRR